jgi:hypothetical protein
MKVSMPLMSGGALRLTEVTDAQEKQVEDLMFLCPRCRAGRCDGYGFLVPLSCGFAEHRANLLEEYRKTAPKRAVAEAEACDLRVCVRQPRPFSGVSRYPCTRGSRRWSARGIHRGRAEAVGSLGTGPA